MKPVGQQESILYKMALTIKDTIDAADKFNNSLLGIGNAEMCILPRSLRAKLGECLDDLSAMDIPEAWES